MNLKEWLPITKRNRVALGLAGLSLVILITWNCMPYYERLDDRPLGIVMVILWPGICDPDQYMDTLKSPDIDGFLEIAATLALIQSGLVTLIAVPLWKILHGSALVRIPLAIVNLLGGLIVMWFVLQLASDVSDDPPPYAIATLGLISGGMLTISASLFAFKSELGLRSERKFAETINE